MEHLDLRVEQGVGILTMQHETQNRFTTPFLEEFLQALKDLETDGKVNSVVFASAHEKYFSTGLHLEWLMMQGAKDPKNIQSFLETMHTLLKTLIVFPKPTIAAINGHVIGAGVFLAACMDYRYMNSDKGLVSLPEVRMNLSFWPGVIALLKECLPRQAFRDLTYTGDKLGSFRAKEIGFIDACFSADRLLSESMIKAARLGVHASASYGIIKRDSMGQVLNTMEREDPKAIAKYMATITP